MGTKYKREEKGKGKNEKKRLKTHLKGLKTQKFRNAIPPTRAASRAEENYGLYVEGGKLAKCIIYTPAKMLEPVLFRVDKNIPSLFWKK